MGRLIILKLGSSFPELVRTRGDFEHWIGLRLGLPGEMIRVVDGTTLLKPPEPAECLGLIMTGSHAMVTERLPWSVRIAAWLPSLLDAEVPILGICYGHQLLAEAAGGAVDYHPMGPEMGTVSLSVTPAAADDPLFSQLPGEFPAHATHSQTVTRLPPTAVRLAESPFEPNHAYRVGRRAWGVQFHPEFDAAVMGRYIEEQRTILETLGRNVPELLASLRETGEASKILQDFGKLVAQG